MMYQPTKSKYEVLHNHDAMKGSNMESSNLLPSLQNCNKSKQQSCICSTTTSTSQIQSNIYLQQQSSRSNGYFSNGDHMINNNPSYQLYRQHSFLDSDLTNNNNNNNHNGLLEHDDNTFTDYTTSIPSSPKGAEQILMILMCNGMTPEFDQFNGKFTFTPTYKYSTNRLRLENPNTNSSSNGTTPSSFSTTPSSSISSPNCNDNLKSHIQSPSTITKQDICSENATTRSKSPKRESISINSQQDQYLSESSNKLDENLTLPPSPCVSDISETEQDKNSEEPFQQITTTTTDQNLIPHKIESIIHGSTESCLSDHHGETTDESSEEEEDAPKAKCLKRATLTTAKRKDQQKTMKLDLSLDSAESSGFISKPANKTYSFRDATIFVLSQVGKPMTAVDITKNIFDNKMVKSAGKTPERTVAAMIYQEMKKKRNLSEFALFGSGLFGLSAWKSDDHTSQDTASVSTDASLSSEKSVDITGLKKKEKKKKRKLATKPEKEDLSEAESDNETNISRRKPRRMHKHKHSSSSDQEETFSLDSEEATSSTKKRKKQNESEDTAIMSEESLFKTYISKLKEREQTETDEDECFVCKNGGDLICCDSRGCRKVYHTSCVGLKEVPKGDWICPHHYCAECKKKSFRSKSSKKCFSCPYSVCGEHSLLLKEKFDNEKFVCTKCKPLCEKIK